MQNKKNKPNGYWNKKENVINFIFILIGSKDFTCYDDLYALTRKDFEEHGGSSLLLKFYRGSIHEVVSYALDSHQWFPWLFRRCKAGFWTSIDNQRWFLDWLGTKLAFTCPEDFYALTTDIVLEHRGSGLLKQYRDSVSLAVSTLYPENPDWHPWLFNKVPNGFWKDRQNCRAYFDWYRQINGLTLQDDIYEITVSEIRATYGGGLIANHHGDSIYDALKFAYPERLIDPTMFRSTPQRHWTNKENCKAFVESIMPKLNITNLDGWYKISREQVVDLGGGGLLVTQYSSSLTTALADLYPEHNWQPWKFTKAPSGYWQSPENRKQFFLYLKEILCINESQEWYGVTKEDIYLHGGGGLLTGFYGDSPSKAIMDVFPEHDWEPEKFFSTGKGQRKLLSILTTILPDEPYEYNFRGSGLTFSVSAKTVAELDIFFPRLKLAFEYQGQQHYHAMDFWHGTYGLISQIRRDEEKRILCERAGITLIEIPYWCDMTVETIVAIISQYRPELVHKLPIGQPPKQPEEILSQTEFKKRNNLREVLRSEFLI